MFTGASQHDGAYCESEKEHLTHYTAGLDSAIASSAEYLPLFSGSSQLVLRKIWHTRIQMGRTLTYPSATAGLAMDGWSSRLLFWLYRIDRISVLSFISGCSQVHLSMIGDTV